MGNSLIELCVRSIFVVAPFAFLACLAQQSMKEQGIIFLQVMSKAYTCSGLFGSAANERTNNQHAHYI